ncbi:MAG: polyA polymerase [Candidatus Saganbacteria bacterium]|uniref:PolyA polymerase n=1 Tax=Candidatus Saganbacteria bacterium TaxID=2575572 RepID=A0A833L1G6_UNCSA|nr:MAG: polyA polymerase [Candidatus Saganbacteria bacterium]
MFEKQNFPNEALIILQTLKEKGYKCYFVGGCIRDLLLGILPQEFDLATDADPKTVASLFEKVIPTGIDFGTVTVLVNGKSFEITTFRKDEKYTDGRHPTSVIFSKDINEDLSRRDFTVNAMAYDPETGALIDNYNGQADIKHKIIKTVGNPETRFKEDGLRAMRACRFAATLNFAIDEKTFSAISKTLNVVKKVALERVHDEIVKMLKAEKPSGGFEFMRKSGLLKLFIPELENCVGVEQPPNYHKYDVYWHNLYSCDAAPKDNLIVRLAALLHDVAKPSCKVDLTFYNHDKAGVKMAEIILKRLKFGNSGIKSVCNLISNHMFDYKSEWSDSAVRRFMCRAGVENLPNLFALRVSDTKAMENEINVDYLKELQARIDKIIAEENALHIKDLKVDGKDIMKELAIAPGKKVGQLLEELLEKVIDDPKLNDREKLLELIRKHA